MMYIDFDLRDFNRNCTFILPFQYEVLFLKENYMIMINKYVEKKIKKKKTISELFSFLEI